MLENSNQNGISTQCKIKSTLHDNSSAQEANNTYWFLQLVRNISIGIVA